MPPRDITNIILKAASHAPSGDNCQPWKFIVEQNRVLIVDLPEKDTSLYNFRNNAAFVAHGALMENIAIASRYHGYEARFELFPEGHENLVCSITFSENRQNNEGLYHVIEKRCTNRKKYATVLLTDHERRTIADSIGDTAEMSLVEKPEQRRMCADAVSLNERLVFETRELHQFLFAHIRWTEAEERRERNGMYVATLELGSKKGLFAMFRHWSMLKFLNGLTWGRVARQVSHENAASYFSSSAIGAILIRDTTARDYIMAGRAMQRVWLTVTKLGLSLQPMTGIAFLYQRILNGVKTPFTEDQVREITRAYQSLERLFESKGSHIVMVFRIGRSEAPSGYSSRLPLESLVEYRV